MTTTALARAGNRPPTKKQRVAIQRASGNVARRASLPEYLELPEINALIHAASHAQARLLMLVQWRAGLRVSEALALEVADLDLDGDRPALRVREGKGGKDRVVPVHPELAAGLRNFLAYSNVKRGPLCDASRSTAWRWLKLALVRAVELGAIPQGRKVGTHTLRHSAARHWLASGVPINHVSLWLGHSSIQTTLIYLEILPDPSGFMDRVP
jgi:integrase